MRKEKDEIIELFHSRLVDTEMPVRDGFWDELAQDIPVAFQHRRRMIFLRVAAAASVLLVLAASSATFWYFSPKEEIEEAFTQIVAANGGTLDGDGVLARPLAQPMKPVLSKPTPKSYGMLKHYTEVDEEESVTVSMSFSFSATVRHEGNTRNNRDGVWQAKVESESVNSGVKEESDLPQNIEEHSAKKRLWAIKAQVGTALPADNGTYKMPISTGVTVERKLNKYLGVETGVIYSNLRSDGQKLHYLGVPVKMNVTLTETKKWDVYATVGGIAEKCIAGAPDNDFKNEPIQLAVTAGVGVRYKINDRLAVFAEPGVSHHFKTDSQLATVRTERPTNFNLLCGIRMTY